MREFKKFFLVLNFIFLFGFGSDVFAMLGPKLDVDEISKKVMVEEETLNDLAKEISKNSLELKYVLFDMKDRQFIEFTSNICISILDRDQLSWRFNEFLQALDISKEGMKDKFAFLFWRMCGFHDFYQRFKVICFLILFEKMFIKDEEKNFFYPRNWWISFIVLWGITNKFFEDNNYNFCKLIKTFRITNFTNVFKEKLFSFELGIIQLLEGELNLSLCEIKMFINTYFSLLLGRLVPC